jgi:conserved domain protein
METIKIDVKGLDCPIPLLEAKKELQKAEKGQIVEIEFTCPEATRSLPSYAQKNGHKVLIFDKLSSGGWKIVIEK